MQSTCLDDDLIAALAEGRLSVTAQAEIEAHIDVCEACRRLVAAAAVDGATQPSPAADAGGVLLPSGTTIARYVVLGPVGAGGMGVVYSAYDPELDRKVAVKLLRPRPSRSTAEQQELVRREAQSMARLAHPNVVTVHDLGTVGERVFVVMEFVQGTTVTSWLRERPRSWRQIVDVFLEAGRGLAAAHATGLVHRDFKPDNVLIDGTGRVLVSDFGLARLAGSDADAGAGSPAPGPRRAGGTPAYMAPEQLDGRAVDARADLFSYCVALYEALHGSRPFAGETPDEVADAMARGRVGPAPRQSRVPAWVRRCLLEGLRADPEGRPPTMDRLLASLRADPGARLRRFAGGAALVAALLGLGTAGGAVVHERALVCTGFEHKLDGVWDAPRKRAVSAALEEGGEGWAVATARIVEDTLDRYARDWIAMRAEACRATRVTHEQSESLLDLRMQCLDERLAEIRGLTDLLVQPADGLVASAARAAYSLQPLRGCADGAALTAPVAPPSDPARRAQVEALRGEVARAKAFRFLGRYQEGVGAAGPLVPRARELGYAPVEGESLLVWADFLDRMGDYARSADAMREALLAAERGGDRRLAAQVLSARVWVDGHERGDAAAGHDDADHGAAILQALGGDAEIEARLDASVGSLLADEGRAAEAEARFRGALDKSVAVFGRTSPESAMALANVGVSLSRQGRDAEALTFYEQALDVYVRTLGDHHPLVGQTLFNVADGLRIVGSLDEARARAGAALALLEEVLGPDHVLVASAENVVGLVALDQRRYADAERHLSRALALAETIRGADHLVVGHYAWALGGSLAGQGRHAEAIAQLRRALAIYAKRGADPGIAAQARADLGRSLLATGSGAEALATLEAALRWQEAHETRARDLAGTRLGVARALVAVGGDPARALRLGQQAVEGFAAAGDPARDDLSLARAWLQETTAHPPLRAAR